MMITENCLTNLPTHSEAGFEPTDHDQGDCARGRIPAREAFHAWPFLSGHMGSSRIPPVALQHGRWTRNTWNKQTHTQVISGVWRPCLTMETRRFALSSPCPPRDNKLPPLQSQLTLRYFKINSLFFEVIADTLRRLDQPRRHLQVKDKCLRWKHSASRLIYWSKCHR